VPRGTSDQKNELFWALMELKERLWLAWAVWGKGDNLDRNTTLRLMDQALDLVQYRELLNLVELRTLLDDLAAKAPGKRLDNEIAALKQMILRYDQDGDAASIH
jgi:hypothetical protein